MKNLALVIPWMIFLLALVGCSADNGAEPGDLETGGSATTLPQDASTGGQAPSVEGTGGSSPQLATGGAQAVIQGTGGNAPAATGGQPSFATGGQAPLATGGYSNQTTNPLNCGPAMGCTWSQVCCMRLQNSVNYPTCVANSGVCRQGTNGTVTWVGGETW